MNTLQVFSENGIEIHSGAKGSLVKKDGVVVKEIPGLIWKGTFPVILCKNGEKSTIVAKSVHWDEAYREPFKFVEPENGGIVVVDVKANDVLADLDYEYVFHRDYHLACRNKSGNVGVISCYRLQKKLREGREDSSEEKVPFSYYDVRIGRHTFGLQKTKRSLVEYISKNGKALSMFLWGQMNSIADAMEQAGELGHRRLVVPSDNYPGLFALFLPEKREVVLDGVQEFKYEEHYFTAIYPDLPDGSCGEVKHFSGDIEQIP